MKTEGVLTKIVSRIKPYLVLITLLVLAIPLRFINLGYSDYIGDEHKTFIEPVGNQTILDFFMQQRKGPMQFLISFIPYLFTHNFRNELTQRMPFALISILVVSIFYLLIKKITKNNLVSALSTFLFLVNGFIVGFGRIAQYQNLNLFFSFLSLYFYFDLLDKDKEKHHLKHTLLGTLFFCLSVLSHWDALFILPVIVYIFVKYFLEKAYNLDKNKNKSKTTNVDKKRIVSKETLIKILMKEKKIILLNFIFGCILLLPFLIPYVNYQMCHDASKEYFQRRVEMGYDNTNTYKLLIDLYNPFFVFWFILITGIISIFCLKKNYIFFIWFFFSYGVFEVFVRKPGTHIYNFIIPALVLSSFGIDFIIKIFPKYLKIIPIFITIIFFSFFYYQTYLIFVDHTKEYPWEQKEILSIKIKVKEHNRASNYKIKRVSKEILNLTTPKYRIEQKLPLFGFPHKRYWNEINDFINTQNKINNENLGYMTNEVKTISEWYMDTDYQADGTYYLISIKTPLSFSNDYQFPQVGNKEAIKTFKKDDRTVVKIYKVECE